MKMTRAYMITLLIVMIAMIYACSSTGGTERKYAPDTEWLDGVWTGTGYQMDDKTTWSIRLIVRGSDNVYRIEYPSLACGGEWRLVSSSSQSGRFVENILIGRDRCADNGTIVITRVDRNHISFTYFYENGVMVAFSTLTRSQ
jgi:hypothetical protein